MCLNLWCFYLQLSRCICFTLNTCFTLNLSTDWTIILVSGLNKTLKVEIRCYHLGQRQHSTLGIWQKEHQFCLLRILVKSLRFLKAETRFKILSLLSPKEREKYINSLSGEQYANSNICIQCKKISCFLYKINPYKCDHHGQIMAFFIYSPHAHFWDYRMNPPHLLSTPPSIKYSWKYFF